MAEVSQNIKYVKLDDGVSFSLVRTNPKLTTNTKLMYNGKKMYMESYASSDLMNRSTYKNVSVKQNSTYNKDIADFLMGSGSQAYSVYQNFSNISISDSYDNQFETLYWCGAEYINSSFYSEEIGFVAPLYLREKLPNYFLIFRLDTPSNYNLNIDENGNKLDSNFNFKTDILDKAVLIKSFDLREGSVLGNYIHNYIDQELFEFDKSMYVNFSKSEITYYGINRTNGVLEKKTENFENELLKTDNPIFVNDKWFTEGFERNNLIFPYIMNIEYLFDDDTFKQNGGELYDFARYIGVYCNNIEFGEFDDFDELKLNETDGDIIYYFEDRNNNLHRYTFIENELKIDGKDEKYFDKNLISGFEKEKITGYAEPLDVNEGFINRSQYGFEILKPFEPGDWIGIEYNNHVDCYFADNINNFSDGKQNMYIGEYSDFRFSVSYNSTINDIAEALVKSVNSNKKSKFEAKCSGNYVVFYAKYEGKEYDSAKILLESSLLYNNKISTHDIDDFKYVNGYDNPIEDISDSDYVVNAEDNSSEEGNHKIIEKSSFGDYYVDYFFGACDVYIDKKTETYKNVFKIFSEEYIYFGLERYLKTNNGNGRKIISNMIYINSEGKIDPEYRIIIVEKAPLGKELNTGYNISVSSINQVEIMDKFKPNYGVFSWFPVKDFDFDINYSTYGEYTLFANECKELNKKIISINEIEIKRADVDRDGIIKLAKSNFFDDNNNPLGSEYDYYYETIHPDLCLISKTVPYVSKWGYYDEQKDSCENTYRLNISKIFGVSNLSANMYLTKCDEKGYTHSMPYYMSPGKSNEDYYSKEYQYIKSDDEYNDMFSNFYETNGTNEINETKYDECVEYWIGKFKDTKEDMFTKILSGKQYGKRFDRKYSRLMGGDKFHNPSTLFRGVKFEVVRQYNGVDKRTSEYNNYKFSFVFIPIMTNDITFRSNVYFVKNDTFKFIVGIVFVNTMLGKYKNNIFNKSTDYFTKGFVYAACKDLIRPEIEDPFHYKITSNEGSSILLDKILHTNEFCNGKNNKEFYIWYGDENNKITDNRAFITNESSINIGIGNIIGECEKVGDNKIENIKIYDKKDNTVYIDEKIVPIIDTKEIKFYSGKKYTNYDIEIYGYNKYKCSEDKIKIETYATNIEFKNIKFVDICEYKGEQKVYDIDVSKFKFINESLRNIFNKLGNDRINKIIFHYNYINDKEETKKENKDYVKEISKDNYNINVNNLGVVEITPKNNNTSLIVNIKDGDINNLYISIEIEDRFDSQNISLTFRDYFSIYNQISIYNIMRNINNDNNIIYHSTVEDNKYKIRVIEPDVIKIYDAYEATPVEITQNNKNIIGSVEINKKTNVDKIGVKTINRYSGFYNPIFNDILYYDDYIKKNIDSDDSDIDDIDNVKYIKEELPYSNIKIDYNYSDDYGKFGIIKNMYYHKTNIYKSNNILTSEKPTYPAINEYALDYRDYNIFSSSWDEGYFITQDDLESNSVCEGIGSMKDSLCMFGSKYLNLPDDIFIDTFENGEYWNENLIVGIRDISNSEIMYKEINGRTVRYYLYIEKRLKRYLKESLIKVFSKYINKDYSFGNKGTIEDDVDEYVEKNLLKLYKLDKVYMYIKSDVMKINNKRIENDYLKYINMNNDIKINNGFQVVKSDGKNVLKNNQFVMTKTNNEFDRIITYNLKTGIKESFGFAVSFKRK